MLYRLGRLTITPITQASGTFIYAKIITQNVTSQQMMNVIFTYINPAPNDTEKTSILNWKELIMEHLEECQNPLLVIGDLNKNGKKIISDNPILSS